MSGEVAETQVPPTLGSLAVERWAPLVPARDRNFWIALGVAVLLHSSLFLGLLGHQPRQIGDADGSEDGISVSVVTEADLQNRSSAPSEAAAGQPAPPPQPPPAEAKPPEPKATDAAPPPMPEPLKPSLTDAEPAPPLPEPVAKPETKPEPADTLAKSITEDVPDLLALPGPGEEPKKKQAPAKPQQPAQEKPQPPKPQQQAKPKQTAKLDLSPPPGSFSAPSGGGGRSAGFERPPGITRSGANDDFARGVIRALQQTMPQLREVLGRVTVRIILNENGNVSDVQVVRPSPIPSLNQSVVFATKQTSYPFPPPNSNLADRTFLVTYIYH